MSKPNSLPPISSLDLSSFDSFFLFSASSLYTASLMVLHIVSFCHLNQ